VPPNERAGAGQRRSGRDHDRRADGGNGTGSVERVDGGAVIRIEGRSLDNAPVTAVLRCRSVH
jgi:hypothetical protein